MTDAKLGLYLMTAKGLAVLRQILNVYGTKHIAYIVTAQDNATKYDGYADIQSIAKHTGIQIYSRLEAPTQQAKYLLAVSWRWLIKTTPNQEIIVFHDSLLPRYRGFAPLVSALINGDEQIGVTALLASNDYDRGPIISQGLVDIHYPITISDAISKLLPIYEKLAVEVVQKFLSGQLDSQQQDDTLASYSLWRDDDDYFIDWSWDAVRIRRFVDAVGFPYKGAATIIDGDIFRITACEALPDIRIENRTVGKIVFLNQGEPVVVCGQGLIQIKKMVVEGSNISSLPLGKFRVRLQSPQTTSMHKKPNAS